MVGIILLAIALSVDAIGLGLSIGIRNTKIGIKAISIISVTGIMVMSISLTLGNAIFTVLPDNSEKLISGVILIIVGLYIMINSIDENENISNKNIIKVSHHGDMDNSGHIDPKEAFFVGLALSIDSIAICVSISKMDYAFIFPIIAVIVQNILMFVFMLVGKKISHMYDNSLCTIASGAIIVILGMISMV